MGGRVLCGLWSPTEGYLKGEGVVTPKEVQFPTNQTPLVFKQSTYIYDSVMKKAFNHILREGTLPPSWQEATLIPILKPEKDHLTCSSYRPIALINVDAKIFTAILTHRLQLIIEQYVHSDQIGFIPHRYMADNIRRVLDVIWHGAKDQTPSVCWLCTLRKHLIRLSENTFYICYNIWILATNFWQQGEQYITLRRQESKLMGLCQKLSPSAEGRGRAVLSLPSFSPSA